MSEVVSKAFYDAGERSFTFLRVQDVEDIIDNNKRLQNEQQRGEWFRQTAEIPNIILHQWLLEEHARGNVTAKLYTKEFDEIIKRKINDPDYAWLRTDAKHLAGRVGYGS